MRILSYFLAALGAAGLTLLAPDVLLAAEGGEAVATIAPSVKVALAIASGFGIGIAAGMGALGQGRATASALSGIARNPGAAAKIQTPMIIGLALIESLVIYALAITFLLQSKI